MESSQHFHSFLIRLRQVPEEAWGSAGRRTDGSRRWLVKVRLKTKRIEQIYIFGWQDVKDLLLIVHRLTLVGHDDLVAAVQSNKCPSPLFPLTRLVPPPPFHFSQQPVHLCQWPVWRTCELPKNLWWALSGDWARRQSGQNKQKRWGRCSREESISLPIVPIFCQTREGRRDLLKQRRKLPIGWANPGQRHQKSNSSSSQFVQIVRSELSHPDLCLPGLFFTSSLPSLVIGFIL